jgi:hypothetical protein
MSPHQRGILRHALGLRTASGRPYRNRFVTGPGSDDYADCMALVAAGLMTRRPGNKLTGGDDVFTVTEFGMRFARIPEKEVWQRLEAAKRRLAEAQAEHEAAMAAWEKL